MNDLLPIGSIVILKDGEKKLMIYGRKQIQTGTAKLWDYIACLYPEGNIDDEHCYLFNHSDIERTIFIGYQDEEEFEFREELKKV